MVAFSTTFFTIFRYFEQLNSLSLTLVALVAATTLMLLIPMSFVMSSMFKMSIQFPRNLGPRPRRANQLIYSQIFQRQLLSCIPVRCQVGGMYYMETNAKLTVIHKVVNGLKYLLVNIKV